MFYKVTDTDVPEKLTNGKCWQTAYTKHAYSDSTCAAKCWFTGADILFTLKNGKTTKGTDHRFKLIAGRRKIAEKYVMCTRRIEELTSKVMPVSVLHEIRAKLYRPDRSDPTALEIYETERITLEILSRYKIHDKFIWANIELPFENVKISFWDTRNPYFEITEVMLEYRNKLMQELEIANSPSPSVSNADKDKSEVHVDANLIGTFDNSMECIQTLCKIEADNPDKAYAYYSYFDDNKQFWDLIRIDNTDEY